jgi:O-acetyl-ADP-ribose deacetylase (regulator of RNase III)
MPLRHITGDIFNSSAQVVVNTVNCKGVMGKGLALRFKRKYPRMFKEYKRECASGRVRPGKLLLYKTPHRWILNFPTKDDWRKKSKLEYVELGLQMFVANYREWGIRSIAFPRLGCDLGGLDWNEVRPLMERHLSELSDLEVAIYTRPSSSRASKQEKLTQWSG